MFSGWATIQHIFNGEIYPAQIELEEPDEEGHRIKRIAFNEIVSVGDEYPGEIVGDMVYYSNENPDIPPVIVPLEKPKRYLAKVHKWRNGYRIGDEYIITKPKKGQYFDVYLKDRPDSGPIGSYVTNFFEIIEPYKEPKNDMPLKRQETPKLDVLVETAINTLESVETSENRPFLREIKGSKKKHVVDGQLAFVLD